MKAVIQRTSEAKVEVGHQVKGQIGRGLMLLIGVEDADTEEDVDYLVRKISKMRIFNDHEGKMNLSLQDIGGSILSISQFTLHADTKKGNRPSFIGAGEPDYAQKLYELLNKKLRAENIIVETGEFGADMQVHLTNDGPVTILIDSKNK